MLGTGGGSLSLGGTGGRSLEVLESFLEILESIKWSPLELLESFLEILDSVKWSPLVLFAFDSALVSLIRTLFTWAFEQDQHQGQVHHEDNHHLYHEDIHHQDHEDCHHCKIHNELNKISSSFWSSTSKTWSFSMKLLYRVYTVH